MFPDNELLFFLSEADWDKRQGETALLRGENNLYQIGPKINY